MNISQQTELSELDRNTIHRSNKDRILIDPASNHVSLP